MGQHSDLKYIAHGVASPGGGSQSVASCYSPSWERGSASLSDRKDCWVPTLCEGYIVGDEEKRCLRLTVFYGHSVANRAREGA